MYNFYEISAEGYVRSHTHARKHTGGWPSGALVFGKLPVPGRPADLD